MRHTRGKSDETTCRERRGLARISGFSHAQPERPRDYGEDLRLGMLMRSDLIPLRKFQPHREHLIFARIPIEDDCLRPERDRMRCGAHLISCGESILWPTVPCAEAKHGSYRQGRSPGWAA